MDLIKYYMYKAKTTHDQILHRLRISIGQLQKVEEMVASGAYCLDVIHQSQAVQRALRQTDHLILENHLKTCTSKAIKSGKASTAITEVMQIIKRWS